MSKSKQQGQENGKEDPREKLAAYAHEAWSGWMKYMFSRCGDKRLGGGYCIPVELVERWQRQMTTPYTDLPENEKESDREEADKIMKLLEVECN